MKKILLVITLFSFYSQIVFGQTEPVNQGTNMQFLGLKAYGMSLRFDASDATKYMILRSTENITAIPVDNVEYLIGETLGNAKVFYNENKRSLYQFRESVANTTYHFAVFAYNQNISGSVVNYKTDNPLKGSQMTSGKEFDGYYNNFRIDTEDALDDLSEKLYNHLHLVYSQFSNVAIENIYEKDTLIGGVSRKYVVCEYSDNIYDYDEGDFSATVFNKEHVLPKSWMPGTVDVSDFPGSDYHNLFNVKASVNSKRLNHPVGNVINESWSDMTSSYGTDAFGENSFEPKESIKGNVARAMFYVLTTYDGLGGSWAFNHIDNPGDEQNVALLLQWHQQDPVDNFEIARNEYLFGIQNNRNPFIDNPDWVDCIDFKTMTLNGNCPLDTAQIDSTIAINEISNNKYVMAYPNPVKSKGFVKLLNNKQIISLSLLNINGESIDLDYEIDNNISTFKIGGVSNGIYILKINTKNSIYIKRIQVLKN